VNREQVLIMNGDTLFDADLEAFSGFHLEHSSACTVALKPMKDSDRYGVVQLDEQGIIRQFNEKSWYAESLINAGVYALDREEFLSLPLPDKFSFEKDYLEKYSSTGRFFGFVQDKYFIDIGIPEDFQKAQIELPLQHD
jgi:D-glycero-alpha-D-manno-heptose 1-phosphate guanylyltransferase